MEYARQGLRNRTYSLGVPDWLIKAVLVLCILLGTSIHLLAYAAFGLAILYLFAVDNERGINCMFFLLPFASIFKASSGGSSFFTYLTIFIALKLIVTKMNINRRFLLTWIILLGFQIAGCRLQLSLLIKQASILLLIYGYFHSCRVDSKNIVLNLAFGMLLSCAAANMTAIFPGISDYMRVVRAYEISSDTYRFIGLYSDPNYLSEALILICMMLFIFIQQKRIGVGYWLVIGMLLVFGAQTLSKSYFLMLAVILGLYIIIAIKQRDSNVLLGFLLGFAVLLGLFLNGRLTALNSILLRFSSEYDLTTGRTEIWKEYIETLISNPLKLTVGFGIGSSPKQMAHNTFLELLYHYGIIGSIVFAFGVKYAIKGRIRHCGIMQLAPAICFILTSCFLSNLMWFDFGYSLIVVLAFMVENVEVNGERLEVREYSDLGDRSVL